MIFHEFLQFLAEFGTETVIHIAYKNACVCTFFCIKEQQSCAVFVSAPFKEVQKNCGNSLSIFCYMLWYGGLQKLRSSCLLKHLLFYDFSAKKGKPTAATAFNKLEEICLMRLRYCRC